MPRVITSRVKIGLKNNKKILNSKQHKCNFKVNLNKIKLEILNYKMRRKITKLMKLNEILL